ncbi:GTP cyclohydrolase I type 2 [Candidatus Burkholderia verschuerenii]|uniref:GTP cyclohydrolase FolE2 n=1 Tax=Candidatus Burkholderia verschuerenii TaxID=242163 RepID=A0A0L0MBH0_9BURK|nr:GTP cyclohydrolase FolE2 [Candidatus Burkholderia verschuerenii]KND59595.1 GTP cyclohydrolase I type 2 [Candidatus Burkholderia verschuerenii]
MHATLPDISVTDTAPGQISLDWVGMQGIDLPLSVDEDGRCRDVHARVDAHVDLPLAHVKGIHMSRLYALVGSLSDGESLSPKRLSTLLDAMIDSHRDCGSRSARVRIAFDLLIRRPALVTEGLSGWKSYPVHVTATKVERLSTVEIQVGVDYASTCPCSAALSRQLVEQAFRQAFVEQEAVTPAQVGDWLRDHATLATPHSQRSRALARVDWPTHTPSLGLTALIDRIEHALGTPVQTAVKRADEQAFAALNGQNLMFVEDAARRVQSALAEHYLNPRVHVRHEESLHPHDAVAWAGAFEGEGS